VKEGKRPSATTPTDFPALRRNSVVVVGLRWGWQTAVTGNTNNWRSVKPIRLLPNSGLLICFGVSGAYRWIAYAGMVHRSLEAALYNFLTADVRPQTAALDKNRRRRSAVSGQICKVGANHAVKN
jgi:hypothetical protein